MANVLGVLFFLKAGKRWFVDVEFVYIGYCLLVLRNVEDTRKICMEVLETGGSCRLSKC